MKIKISIRSINSLKVLSDSWIFQTNQLIIQLINKEDISRYKVYALKEMLSRSTLRCVGNISV